MSDKKFSKYFTKRDEKIDFVKFNNDRDLDYTALDNDFNISNSSLEVSKFAKFFSNPYDDNGSVGKIQTPKNASFEESSAITSPSTCVPMDYKTFCYTHLSTTSSSTTYSNMFQGDSHNHYFSDCNNNNIYGDQYQDNADMNHGVNDATNINSFKPNVFSTPLSNKNYDHSYSINKIAFINRPAEIKQIFFDAGSVIPTCDAHFTRQQNKKVDKKYLAGICVFCKNNGQSMDVYTSHTLNDAKGRVLCPKLRVYRCPLCGVDGDYAHTVKYCPKKPIITLEDTIKMEKSKNKYA